MPAVRGGLWWLLALGGVGLATISAGVWALSSSPQQIRSRAEAAAKAGQWASSLADWRLVNRDATADAQSWMGEARACLALGLAAQAEQALEQASELDPTDPTPWLIRLEIVRVENRPIEALRIGWLAYDAVPPSSRREVLRALTLALLADTPDDLARETLERWIRADPDDIDALVALRRRMGDMPHADDPDRTQQIADLTVLVERHPDHINVREALIQTLARAGEPDRGRAWLDAWPSEHRDIRYDRLRGRWDLDYDHQYEHAVASFRRVLAELPHDWKTHYRLARALQALGRSNEARAEAETVARLREVLDPARLGPRLDDDLARLDQPDARLDLADLCAHVGLTRLADAWRLDATSPTPAVDDDNKALYPGLLGHDFGHIPASKSGVFSR